MLWILHIWWILFFSYDEKFLLMLQTIIILLCIDFFSVINNETDIEQSILIVISKNVAKPFEVSKWSMTWSTNIVLLLLL